MGTFWSFGGEWVLDLSRRATLTSLILPRCASTPTVTVEQVEGDEQPDGASPSSTSPAVSM